MQSQAKALTIMDALFPRSLARDVLLVVAFTAITAFCAQISFRIGVVPITGQTFAVLLAGALLGSRRGAMSQVAYLAAGAAGAPIFANFMGGPLVLVGPTAGYLVGFVPAAFIVGYLAERGWDRRVWTTAAAMLLGTMVIWAFGLAWLDRFIPNGLLSIGLYPFVAGDMIKVALAAAALPSGWALLRRLGR